MRTAVVCVVVVDARVEPELVLAKFKLLRVLPHRFAIFCKELSERALVPLARFKLDILVQFSKRASMPLSVIFVQPAKSKTERKGQDVAKRIKERSESCLGE